MLQFDMIREAIEDRDLRTAEEIIDEIDCYDQIKGIARKVLGLMRDPECYTFPLYRKFLKKCYDKTRDWDIFNLIKRADDRECFFYLEEELDEEDDEEEKYY